MVMAAKTLVRVHLPWSGGGYTSYLLTKLAWALVTDAQTLVHVHLPWSGEVHASSLLASLARAMVTAVQTLVHVHNTKCNILTGTYLMKQLFGFHSILNYNV
jgi:hypothetical protein